MSWKKLFKQETLETLKYSIVIFFSPLCISASHFFFVVALRRFSTICWTYTSWSSHSNRAAAASSKKKCENEDQVTASCLVIVWNLFYLIFKRANDQQKNTRHKFYFNILLLYYLRSCVSLLLNSLWKCLRFFSLFAKFNIKKVKIERRYKKEEYLISIVKLFNLCVVGRFV